MKFWINSLCLGILICLIGCSTFKLKSEEPKGSVLIANMRGGDPKELEIERVTFTRKDLAQAAAHPETAKVRLVRLTRPGSSDGAPPEFRLFDVHENSAPYIIGLRSADILVAAHGYVVYTPQQFGSYLRLLPKENTGSIEVNREGRPIRFEITIVE